MITSPKRPPLPVLTSLRFFAAADVVVYHEISAEIQNPFLHDLSAGAYQAVTFFFVLSGFIL
jgi:peptidoglycan/LPS O-acetylase OafA/YrhL